MTTTKSQPLFRQEALEAQRAPWLGEIVLIRPLSFRFFSLLAAAILILVVLFFVFGSYTKRSTLVGQLLPDVGVVKIFVPQSGVVIEKQVVDGQRVQQGQLLYVLSGERHSREGGIQAAISEQLQMRQHSLQQEYPKTKLLQHRERQSVRKRIEGLEAELAKLAVQVLDAQQRVRLAQATLGRYQDLLAKGFISQEKTQQAQADVLDQRARLQALEREHIVAQRDLAISQNELASLPYKHQNQLAQLERSIAAIHQELTESEARRRFVVRAPQGGIATAVVAEVGQAVTPNRPLLNLLPENAHLQAYLYAPSQAVGFINVGQTVLLRYRAFPYQKFGNYRGNVVGIAKTALPMSELSAVGQGIDSATQEPLYRVTVALAKQTVRAYGKELPLQSGMTLEADVTLDKRRLYEWVLEPFYSLSGKW